MKKIITFLKKYLWVWIIIIVVVAYTGDLYLQKAGQKPSATPSPTPVSQTASYKSIVPGIGTETELTKLLGKPLTQSTTGNQALLTYKSTNVYRHHVAIIENGKVVLIKEIVNSNDNKNADSVTSVYGVAPNTLYSKLPGASFSLCVYPSNGIAYLGHPDGTLLEIWYFQPTTIEGFISSWGQDYSTTPTSNENVY